MTPDYIVEAGPRLRWDEEAERYAPHPVWQLRENWRKLCENDAARAEETWS